MASASLGGPAPRRAVAAPRRPGPGGRRGRRRRTASCPAGRAAERVGLAPRTRKVAWKASSASCGSRSSRRQTPRTIGPCRRDQRLEGGLVAPGDEPIEQLTLAHPRDASQGEQPVDLPEHGAELSDGHESTSPSRSDTRYCTIDGPRIRLSAESARGRIGGADRQEAERPVAEHAAHGGRRSAGGSAVSPSRGSGRPSRQPARTASSRRTRGRPVGQGVPFKADHHLRPGAMDLAAPDLDDLADPYRLVQRRSSTRFRTRLAFKPAAR